MQKLAQYVHIELSLFLFLGPHEVFHVNLLRESIAGAGRVHW